MTNPYSVQNLKDGVWSRKVESDIGVMRPGEANNYSGFGYAYSHAFRVNLTVDKHPKKVQLVLTLDQVLELRDKLNKAIGLTITDLQSRINDRFRDGLRQGIRPC